MGFENLYVLYVKCSRAGLSLLLSPAITFPTLVVNVLALSFALQGRGVRVPILFWWSLPWGVLAVVSTGQLKAQRFYLIPVPCHTVLR